MTRLAQIFLATTVVSLVAAIVLGLALVQEAQRASANADEGYVRGFRDGGVYVIVKIERARIEREIIEESLAQAGKEKL